MKLDITEKFDAPSDEWNFSKLWNIVKQPFTKFGRKLFKKTKSLFVADLKDEDKFIAVRSDKAYV